MGRITCNRQIRGYDQMATSKCITLEANRAPTML